ncbi:MAG: hydrogenase maturation protease [Nitrospinae bacterium CG11_big_fil_rev_8_21_14_0_20_45_15]|nr:MAG: hydrogenase maturation protease [Nitrospinae bacterium CG11_big_fil_rev_8_21_14_0_20_45_15]
MGVGNLYRCDDAIGILIARNLKNKNCGNMIVREQSGEGTSLMEAWQHFNRVILVDAVSSGASPGTLHCLDASTDSIPSRFFSCSSHNFSVAEAIELARTLNQLPQSLKLYGIEGKNFQHGETVTPELEAMIEPVTNQIIQFVSSPH